MIWLPAHLDKLLDTAQSGGRLTVTCTNPEGAYKLRNALYHRKRKRGLEGYTLKLHLHQVTIMKFPTVIMES